MSPYALIRRASRAPPCPLLEVFLPRLQSRGAAVHDPNRRFATLNCRGAKGLFDHVVGADERRDRHGNSVNAAALCASINDDESASITSARFSHCYDDGKSVYVHGVHTGGTISP
jgi:hypothetical protein